MSATQLAANAWKWKLAIFKCINGTMMVGEGTALAALNTQSWIPDKQKLIWSFILGILIAMQKSVEMYISTDIANLKQAAIDGGTQFFRQTQPTQTQQTPQ